MNKISKVFLIVAIIIMLTSSVFADEIMAPDSNDILRAYPCDECGKALVPSSKTMSILTSQDLISCGSVYGNPGVGDDFKITYDVYNTYVCSGCGYTLRRDYIGQQIKYYCIEGSKYYDPITGQSFGFNCVVENHDDGCLGHEHDLFYNGNINANKVVRNEEVIYGILAEVCSVCDRGKLFKTDILILSDDYTVQSRTVPCIEFPDFRRDEVWRYYFHNTYKCNYCDAIYKGEKTQYYEEWGFCAHGYGGKYPLNVINRESL